MVYAVGDVAEGVENQTKYNVYFSTAEAAFTSVGSANLDQAACAGLPASGEATLGN